MSLLEQQNALARLLTDPELRERFGTEPDVVGGELELQADEIDDLLTVAASELVIFADSLVTKRFNEVSKLLPITSRVAGEQFRDLFLEFAPTYNPRSVKKHYEDAVAFSRFMEIKEIPEMVRDAARLERTRLMFFNGNGRFSCCRSRYNLNGLSGSAVEASMRKLGFLTLWFRIGRRVFHFVI